jgi:hypothetical protein
VSHPQGAEIIAPKPMVANVGLDCVSEPRDATGLNSFTDIITRVEARVLDPMTGSVLGVTTLPVNFLPLNPDPNILRCNVPAPPGDTQQRYYEFDLDVAFPAASSSTDVIELTYVGNYE